MTAQFQLLCTVWVFLCYLPVPTESSQVLKYFIREEQPVGTILGTVSKDSNLADKFNGSLPSSLEFQLLDPTPYFDLGSQTSVLRTSQVLDRELMCMDTPEDCFIDLDVVAGPSYTNFQIIKVKIEIEDVNDNSPMFPQQSLDLTIPEDRPVNSTYFLPVATDRDSTKYGIADYELQSHTGAFRINSVAMEYGVTELLLILVKKLDRETRGSYMLKLVARDYGQPSRSGMMWLNITVEDVNDFTPIFGQPLYNVRVPESARPQIMLTRLQATDQDSGDNAAIKYAISRRASPKMKRLFELNELTGELYLRQQLDYEVDKTLLLMVEACDSAPLAKCGKAVVNISVADVNDNSPAINIRTIGSSKAQVPEHSPNGTFIAHVRVVDGDSGANGIVTCIITSPYFSLRESYASEYNLVVNAALDREKHSEINVTIICSDSGSPPRSSRAPLVVNIIDVNDQKPAFDRLVYSTPLIAENNEVGVHVVQVRASDKDLNTNAEIQYRLGGEEDTGYFSIDKLSGLITAKSRLDRERQGTYTFSVLAVDRGDPPLTATAAVFVQIADLNDNAPSFNVTHYEMSVAENMPKYSFVGKVTAMDPDERANGNVWYRIANASSGPFIIAHDTGIISTRSPLDREKIGGGQYQVTVVATDYGTPALSSDIKVNIHVLDENDNKPIITSAENMTLTCSYQTPVNTTIGKVVAFDPDTAENGRIGYFIQHGNSYGMFKIDKRSGEIKVQSKINSAMAGYYRLGIGVHDNGLPPHTVMSSVGIDVTKEAYVPPEHLVGYDHVSRKTPNHRTYNVNLVVVIVLSSISGVLSVILIVAIIRIKRQTKENHSYNCRTEAQKLFNQSARGGSQPYRPSCESSWAALSTTDRSSVYSRTSGASDNEADEPIAVQTFMTTFSKTTSDVALALQSYEKSNLQKQSRILNKSVNSSRGSAMLHRAVLNKTLKEPDGDSGTCEDTCSVHNSTPVLAASQNENPSSTQGPSLQSFESKFLATSTNMEEVQETKVPSSINSVDNSLNTNSSHNGSPALLDQNSSANHKHEDGSVVSAHITSHQPNHGASARRPKPAQESSSDNYPTHNTSEYSDQTINGERLCAHIDDLFFSEIV